MSPHLHRFAGRILPLHFAVMMALGFVQPALAAPVYSIQPLGFDDLEHTRSDGFQFSQAIGINEAGQIIGTSSRFNGGGVNLGGSAWLYSDATTVNIGLTGSEYTRDDGRKSSSASYMNQAGQVAGTSERYNEGSEFLGSSNWLYNGTATINIGLTGDDYTREDGYKSSTLNGLNDAGQAIGTSDRFSGANHGTSAWLYNGTTTVNIGLVDSEHTRSGGYQSSNVSYLNEAGQASGVSSRFNGGSSDLGASIWLYNGTTTLNVGLAGGEHTRNDGYKYSQQYSMNEAGQVSGFSERYSGDTYLGRSAWLSNGATTLNIGLTGPEHTSSNDFKYSEAFFRMNEAGQAIGYSWRYSGSTWMGQSAWLFNGITTLNIGFTGSEYTGGDGYRNSNVIQLNEAGQVSGVSYRFDGTGAALGPTAWLFNGTTTVAIGLTGTEHTRSDGYRNSNSGFFGLNQAGQVNGVSSRFDGGSDDLGQTTWFYNGATTVAIGLTGAEHTRDDGYKFSSNYSMNETGQVSGNSNRYDGGGTQLGQDAWLYDPTLGQTFSLNLSTRSDGYAFSSTSYLGDDGLTLGTYTLFDAFDNDLGTRAFSFTVADGLQDLGSLVDGGLSASGWEWLADALRANGMGRIIGQGFRTGPANSEMAYLLTPNLPGDFNGNGTVDAADYVVWRNGDSPDDSQVGFNLWKANFGRSAASGASTIAHAASQSVPEPSTLPLATGSFVACLSMCRRHRHRSTRLIASSLAG